jgi:two-component system alkaline phosphatase synthesis response regulator PhoP
MSNELVLVVEDDDAVAAGLVAGLEMVGFRVQHAPTGHEALARVRAEPPDCLVLDLRLPDMHGFDVCRQLRRPEPGGATGSAPWNGPILILTALHDEVDKVVGLEIGADDYLTKPYSLRELVARIRAILRRTQHVPDPGQAAVLRYGTITVDLARQSVSRAGQPVALTATEFKLLVHLARHPGRVFSRDELLQVVWGHESFVGDERTVDVHMSHLRQKLEEDPAHPRYLLTLRGAGYKLED